MICVIIDDQLVDVTSILRWHPGGSYCLESNNGCDVTDVFHAIHRNVNFSPLVVETVVSDATKAHVQDFRKLHRWMKEMGWYYPDKLHFFKHASMECFLFVFSMYCTFSNMPIMGAFLLGVFWHHSAGIGHDLGHSSVFKTRQTNFLIGSLLSTVTGLSSSWWRHSHFQHHIHTNILNEDPDIMHLPIFAITERLFTHDFHNFLKVPMQSNALTKALVTLQHITLYPILYLARFNLYVQSVSHIVSFNEVPSSAVFYRIERFGIAVFFCWYALVLWYVAQWKDVILYVLISHITSGILHVQIAVSHWASETYDDHTTDHYQHTLNTTLDIDCSERMDWFYLGLQFQVTHHLYPRLPRYRLREATQYVRQICEKHQLTYKTVDFQEANLLLYATMKMTSERLRANFKKIEYKK